MTNYNHQPPSETDFRNNLAFNFPEVASVINNLCIEFEDKGNAYYFDGGKNHGWNINALIISFIGSSGRISKLKQLRKELLMQKCEDIIPGSAGFDVVDIKYIIKEEGNIFQSVPDEVEEKIRAISTRNADFDRMEIDEKLCLLNNLIEHLLKRNKKFINPDYENIFFGYIDENRVTGFRKQTQCFRHASQESIAERLAMPHDRKEFLCDLGIFIAIHIHKYISAN